MDADGYPDDEELATITGWPHTHPEGWAGLLAFVRERWRNADHGYWFVDDGKGALKQPVRRYHLSTSGWSGNESIIGAMQANTHFWAVCWFQSQRGGHFIFEVGS